MCDDVVSIPIPDFLMNDAIREGLLTAHPEYAHDDAGVPCFRLDRCIAPAIEALWAAGIRTRGCCCGHGSGHGVISLVTEARDRDARDRAAGRDG